MSVVADIKPRAESLLAKHEQAGRARLRIYLGAAPGVGKTYEMLEEAHQLQRQGVDIVIAFVEPHGRADTEALIDGLECIPLKQIEYKTVTLRELDVDAVIKRDPAVVVSDE